MNKIAIGVLVTASLIMVGLYVSKSSQTSNESTNAKSSEPTYTEQDVAKHNSTSDCWMSIDGKVYNVSSYIKIHKSRRIIDGCGLDASKLYNNERKHLGREALLKTMLVGDLAD